MLSDPSFKRSMAAIAWMGWVLVISAVGGGLLGRWLDRRWGSEPWLLVLGFVTGSATGIAYTWRVSRNKRNESGR